MSNIEEIYKRDNSDFSEKLEMRETLARETVEKENLFNNNPFDKQIDTLSNGFNMAFASPPLAITALKKRAPSRWVCKPLACAKSHACSIYDGFNTLP